MGTMILAIVSTLFWLEAAGSGVGHLVSAPIVAATSSQYFARTFNRLVETPTVFAAPPPRVPAPALPPIVVAPLPTEPTAVTTAPHPRPTDDQIRPVVAIATAQALIQPLFINAPVPIPGEIVTPQFQFLPLGENSAPQLQNREKSTKTTVSSNSNFESTSNLDVTKTSTVSETVNQQPSNSPDNFEEQFKQQQHFLAKQHQEIIRQQILIKQERYLNEQQLIKQQQLLNQLQQQRQQQLLREQQLQFKQPPTKTSVEIVPVPLAYIAPPPIRFSSALRQLHTFVPARPFQPSGQLRLSPVKAHGRLTAYNSEPTRANNPGVLQKPRSRDVEPTTLRIPRFNNVTRPPRK